MDDSESSDGESSDTPSSGLARLPMYVVRSVMDYGAAYNPGSLRIASRHGREAVDAAAGSHGPCTLHVAELRDGIFYSEARADDRASSSIAREDLELRLFLCARGPRASACVDIVRSLMRSLRERIGSARDGVEWISRITLGISDYYVKASYVSVPDGELRSMHRRSRLGRRIPSPPLELLAYWIVQGVLGGAGGKIQIFYYVRGSFDMGRFYYAMGSSGTLDREVHRWNTLTRFDARGECLRLLWF